MPRTTLYGYKNVQVPIQPNIGLDAVARHAVVEMLNLLLADESMLVSKTRRADGYTGIDGVSGPQSTYDSQYGQINDLIGEITERVKILGGSPLCSAEQLMNSARLSGDLHVVPGILSILADHEALIRFLREDAQKCSEVYEDQGTFALLVNVMRIHEKMAWILRSNIVPDPMEKIE